MFEPMNFVYYLKYMGIGMLGVFIIIGIIILATYLIRITTNKASAAIEARRTSKNDDE